MNCKSTLVYCASLLLAATNWAAQFVEVEAVIDVTTWRHDEETSLSLKSSRSFSVRCVVGTNTWFMENHAQTNYKQSAWFVDGKIIRQTTANQGAYQDSVSDEPGYLSVRRGYRPVNVTVSTDGYPGADMF